MRFSQFMTRYEMVTRLGCFFCVFGLMAAGECVAPRRDMSVPTAIRRVNNLDIVFLNSFAAASRAMRSIAANWERTDAI